MAASARSGPGYCGPRGGACAGLRVRVPPFQGTSPRMHGRQARHDLEHASAGPGLPMSLAEGYRPDATGYPGTFPKTNSGRADTTSITVRVRPGQLERHEI